MRNVASGARSLAPEQCVLVERQSGAQVRRWDLRPNDWHRIWPELIDTPGAPPVPADAAQHLQAPDAAGEEAGKGLAKFVGQGA
jgi:DNA-binding transcriptional regulator YdaS (Cro superfamily)